MRLIPSDPDIETLLRRIDDDELDLQPAFQRGEVWSDRKKRLLVDSILRQWHIPPIHVVETDLGEEVLDGQQRLVAIRDFHQGKIRVDGNAQPPDPSIEKLHNLSYHDLPEDVQRRFKRFTIRLFKIVDYSAEEAAELFYRLNQPVTLTAPEQRNAFFGPARSDVRTEVESNPDVFNADYLGFSNSRMAWDDVLARVLFTLEQGTLRTKVTSGRLANRYREQAHFSSEAIGLARRGLKVLTAAQQSPADPVRFNKATLFSWIYFLSVAEGTELVEGSQIAKFIELVELARQRVRHDNAPPFEGGLLGSSAIARLLLLFHDRATSRVGDVFSVLARDFVLWSCAYSYSEHLGLHPLVAANPKVTAAVVEVVNTASAWAPPMSDEQADEYPTFEDVLDDELNRCAWGVRS